MQSRIVARVGAFCLMVPYRYGTVTLGSVSDCNLQLNCANKQLHVRSMRSWNCGLWKFLILVVGLQRNFRSWPDPSKTKRSLLYCRPGVYSTKCVTTHRIHDQKNFRISHWYATLSTQLLLLVILLSNLILHFRRSVN